MAAKDQTKYRYPEDTELALLFEDLGSIPKVAKYLGINSWALRSYVDRKVNRDLICNAKLVYKEKQEKKFAEQRAVWRIKDRANNPEKRKAYEKNYAKRNPHIRRKWNIYNYNRRRGTRITGATAKEVAKFRGLPCIYCRKPSDSVDHLTPVKLGGTSDLWNLAPACISCNCAKGSKTIVEFLAKNRAAVMLNG